VIKGVSGKILWVDLSAGTCQIEAVPEAVYEHYLAGIGLAAYYLYRRIPANVDALGPENILAFVPGLLTGTGAMMTGRWLVAGKSPLTGTWGDANCGGTLAPAIKGAGFDGIFFSGISPKPVYLYLDHNQAELRDATELWGKDARETETLIQASNQGKPLQVACIGLGGEKLSLIAGIVNDQGRMAARSGLGAVMGSKHLKALAIKGSHPVTVADRESMKKLTADFLKFARFQPPFLNGKGMRFLGTMLGKMPLVMRQDGMLYKVLLKKWGTVSMNEYSIQTGDSPIRNWSGSNIDFDAKKAASIDPDELLKRETGKYHCYSCPIGCGGLCELPGRKGDTHKPEYETILALGGLLMNEDVDSLFEMNERLNRAGLDSISVGGVIAFAIECFEQGILTTADTDGIVLKWGNADGIMALMQKIIAREGIGDLLADGTKLAAKRIGKDSEAFAVNAGGQEPAMHDGRADPGFALHYAVEPTPGRHTVGSQLYYEMYRLWKKSSRVPKPPALFFSKNKRYEVSKYLAGMATANSQFKMVIDASGLCIFGSFIGVDRIPVFEWLNAATDWQKTPDEYLEIGRQISSLRQAFNEKQGAPLRHKLNPRLIGTLPLTEGVNKGRSVDLDGLVPLYWDLMGWDTATGQPAAADLVFVQREGTV
jgi:aldehyde:ferredoxin oxidoreductase